MSREEWGELLTTRETYGEAREYVRQLNVAISRMPLTDEERLAIVFTIKSVFFQTKDGRAKAQKTHYIYATELPRRFRHGRQDGIRHGQPANRG